jgi:hypothetical protein
VALLLLLSLLLALLLLSLLLLALLLLSLLLLLLLELPEPFLVRQIIRRSTISSFTTTSPFEWRVASLMFSYLFQDVSLINANSKTLECTFDSVHRTSNRPRGFS